MSRAVRLLELGDLLRGREATTVDSDREGRRTTRRIEPHELLVQPPVWDVLARDVALGAPRMFRMDRIARPRLLREISFVPDLAAAWAQLPDGVPWQQLSAGDAADGGRR